VNEPELIPLEQAARILRAQMLRNLAAIARELALLRWHRLWPGHLRATDARTPETRRLVAEARALLGRGLGVVGRGESNQVVWRRPKTSSIQLCDNLLHHIQVHRTDIASNPTRERPLVDA
jgi:hypothetical protein